MLLSSAGTVYADNVSQIIGDGNTVVFVDVPQDYWAKSEIEYFAQQGIVEGTGNNSFEPEGGVTREQLAKMLVLTFGAPLTSPSEATFSDVPKDKWSYTYVETSKNFLTGYANPFGGAPSFHPETDATREDIAVALVRMMGLTDKDVNNASYAYNFRDADNISPALLPYVSLAAERGLIKGYEDGTFAPQQGITRAETVTLLNRATKQAVTNINSELELSAKTVTGDNPKEVTIIIQTEEGASVTIDGQSVKMESDYDGGYAGAFLYTFTEEGTKTFTVEASKAGKKRSVQVTAKYEIGAPTLNVNQSDQTVTDKDFTLSGKATDASNSITLTINGSNVYVDSYNGSWSKSFTLTEGVNTFTIVATNENGKSTTITRTITYSVGAPTLTVSQGDQSVTNKEFTLSGKATDANYSVTLTINGSNVYVDSYNGILLLQGDLPETEFQPQQGKINGGILP